MNEPLEPESPEWRERLVAYLDGELDGASARQVEERLARDPRVEREMREFDRTWDLLDRLPRAEVDPSFTRSTVEMAAMALAEEMQSARAGHHSRWTFVTIALAAAAAVGFCGARLWPDANDRLLRDLSIVENLEAYRQTPSLDFARQLWQAGLFVEDSPGDAAPSNSLDDDARLQSLTADEKQGLHREYERFVHLPVEEQDRLRKLSADVRADKQSAQLTAVLARFERWLEQRQGVERAELMALEGEQRLARIRRLREDEARRLSATDAQVFVDWIEAQLLARFPAARRRQIEQRLAGQPEPVRREILGYTLNELRRAPGNPGGRPSLAGLAALLGGERGAALHARLSPRGQQQLDKAETLEERRRLLQTWLGQLFSPAARGVQISLPEVTDEELKRFFETQLDPAQRAQLLNLPADQMQRQLRLRYHQSQRTPASPRSTTEDRRE
ncbi:MAG TPA: zf-HC2 domain-containing protein [Pirellulales bacterium]|nr:zf-HC2 domain-containing protein [Pirellulales bacterium]